MFYFIRHGETDFNLEGLWMGCTDIQLNATGLQQALQAAKTLSTMPIDVIYTSPLQRAYETAKQIAAYQQKRPKVVIIDELKERNFGILEGTKRTVPLGTDLDSTEGIETHAQLLVRLQSAMEKVTPEPEQTVLIVSHSGVFYCLTHDLGYSTTPPTLTDSIPNCQAVELHKNN